MAPVKTPAVEEMENQVAKATASMKDDATVLRYLLVEWLGDRRHAMNVEQVRLVAAMAGDIVDRMGGAYRQALTVSVFEEDGTFVTPTRPDFFLTLFKGERRY